MPAKCPQCGTPLPVGTLAGLCPACLLQAGAAADTVSEPKQPAFQPPAVAELAAKFPQLEILELIGKGGMGAVYKARQTQLDRLVALKILPPGIGEDPAFAERFAREAKALAKLNHPGIVTIYDFGRADGLFYFIMEFVDGVNLRQLLHAGRISPREALAIVPQICDALQFAHDQGIVHRDIKPENIMMDRRGRVKVADFGLAKIVGKGAPLTPSLSPSDGERVAKPGEGTPVLTESGKVMGTPQYMAPEQKEHPDTVDHRADIYALGVVFYQMLTGELPGKFIEPPSHKVQVDVRLDEVVLRALEKKPELRYQQASVLKTQVETIAQTPPQGSAAPDFAEFTQAALARDYALNISHCLNRGWKLLISDFWPIVGVSALIWLLSSLATSSVVGIIVSYPLQGGLWLYFLNRIRGRPATVETAFSGFKVAFLQLVLAGLVTKVLLVIGFVCLILPGLYLWVGWTFAMALVVDQRLDFWPAMGLSRKVISKHWWKFFWFLIVLALIHLAGLLALYVGKFIATPLCLAALAYAYEDIFGSVAREAGSVPAGKPANVPIARARAGNGWGIAFGIAAGTAAVVVFIAVLGLLAAIAIPNFVKAREHAIALREQQSTANSWNSLGWAQFNAGNSAEAEISFQKAIAIEPKQPGALNGLGQICLSRRKFDEAEKYLLEAAPQAPAACFGLARLYLLEGKFDQAQKWAQKVVDSGQADETANKMLAAAKAKKLPDGLRLLLEPPVASPASQVQVSSNSANVTPSPQAEQPFHIGQAWFPKGDSIVITSVDRNGQRIIVKGHYELVSADQASLAFYITTTNRIAVPTDASQRMQVSKGHGDFELTHSHLVPGMPHVSLYSTNGNPVASIYFGTEAEVAEASKTNLGREQATGDAAQLTQEGWQLWQAHKLDEAAVKFQQAVQLAPRDANAWNGLGWSQFNGGNSAAAETSFQMAFAIDSKQPGALNGLGQIYLSQRKYDDAEKYLLQAAPQAPAAWFGLARVYLLQGKFDQAQKWAQNVVDSGQADETANKMLAAAKEKKLSEGLRLLLEPSAVAQTNQISLAAEAPAAEAPAGVIEREVNKSVLDFPEPPDFSTPEAACAAWERACARMDTAAINQMSAAQKKPGQYADWYLREQQRDTEGMAIYAKAKIIVVQTWHDDLANVIADIPFPPGTPRSEYSLVYFGRVDGQWKYLTDERFPDLASGKAHFQQNKEDMWQFFLRAKAGEFLAGPETNGLSGTNGTWSPTLVSGEKPDLQNILDAAKGFMGEGSYEEALQRYLWYFDHSRHHAGQQGVRISFALSDWIELGRRYPKARQALLEIRDNDAREFSAGRGYADLFQEVAAINHYLNDDQATLALFKTTQQLDKTLAQQCFGQVQSLLVQKGEYDLCLSYLGDPQANFENLERSWKRTKQMEEHMSDLRQQQARRMQAFAQSNSAIAAAPFSLPEPPKFADNNFVGQVRQLIEILVATGHQADAEKIRDQAVAELDDARLKSAVSDAEQKLPRQKSASGSGNDASQLLAQQPPVVVETFPASGSQDVPPGETEIRVRFSKPMTDDSWSWSTAWEDSTPESVGRPYYDADDKTCVMKVKLEPGKTYAWWLNSDKFKNFQDRAGQPAVPYLLIFSTRSTNASPRRVTAEKADADAPSVLSVFPADGATNVDLVQDLRLRFSEPMNPGSMELDLGGGFTPDGQYHYEPDHKEFVIPVRLLPGQTNDMSINFFGGFKSVSGTAARKFHWKFTTKPGEIKAGVPKPQMVNISPAATGPLPVLTMLQVSFDQPMRPPEQGFPFLEKSPFSDAPAVIQNFSYDPQAHRFTVPLLLPPDNPVKLTLKGFCGADGVPADPVVFRCEVGTNDYSLEQSKAIANAAADPRLKQLLAAMQKARQHFASGVETVGNEFLYGNESWNSIRANHAVFKWQGTNQSYGDITDVMNTKAFILGDDGKTCWLFSDGEDGQSLQTCQNSLMAHINTSIADPFALTSRSVATVIAEDKLVYLGQAQLDGRTCHRVQSWTVHQSHDKYDRTSAECSEWWIDAATDLPARLVESATYGCQIFTFHYDKLNQPLPAAAFKPPMVTNPSPKADEYKLFKNETPAPDEKRFITIRDGGDGRMSGRLGRHDSMGTTSSGLN